AENGVQNHRLIVAKSHIGFVSTQMGVPVEGRFRGFSGNIAFDAAHPEQTRALIEVDLSSIDMGSTEAETEVKRKTWFNVAAFPKARFVAAEVRALGGERYEAKGKLEIKGIARDITAPLTIKRDPKGVFSAQGEFNIPRLGFNIGEGIWSDTDTVADRVQVKFRLTLLKP
ncbi:MAG: YceI family protein, partial [Burkholderiales bacterium]